MKKIIDYLFYRYYLISIKNEEFPRFGATCVLAEVVCYNGLFVCCADIVVSLNWRFLFTQYIRENKNNNWDNRLFSALAYHISTLQQKKNKRPWPIIYLHYNKKRINVLLEKYQNNRYNTKYSDKTVLSLRYIVPTAGLILMLLLYQFR